MPNDDHALNIIVKGITCLDSKTGKSYETTITVVMSSVLVLIFDFIMTSYMT